MLFLVPVGNGFVCVGDAGTLVFLMNDAHCSPLLSLCVCNITHNDECATKKPGFFGNPGESTRITALSRYVFTGIQDSTHETRALNFSSYKRDMMVNIELTK